MTTKGRPELQELIGEWRARANVLRPKRYIGSDDAANATETCADELEAALRAHPDLRAWQGIETAPKDGTLVLLFYRYLQPTKGLDFVMWMGRWKDDHWTRKGYHGQPTHWMPLPDHPDAALRSLKEGRQAQTEASAAPQEEK